MVEPVKICLSSSLVAMQNLVAVCHAVSAHVVMCQKFGVAGAHSLGIEIVPYTVEIWPSPHVNVGLPIWSVYVKPHGQVKVTKNFGRRWGLAPLG